MKKLVDMLTIFMATIGVCAASLVCFILIYPQVYGDFSPREPKALLQNKIEDGADNNTDEPDMLFANVSQDGPTGTDSQAEVSDYVMPTDYDYSENIIENDTFTSSDDSFIESLSSEPESYAGNRIFPAGVPVSNTSENNYSPVITTPIEQNTSEYDYTPVITTPIEQNISGVDSTTVVAYQEPIQTTTSNSLISTGNANNFNTYDNPEQQQTLDSYVLNTNTRKIHYPSCDSVLRIAPDNYSTSNSSVSELIAQGYSTCGICFK